MKKTVQQTLVINYIQSDLAEAGIPDYIFSYSGESDSESEVVE